MIKNSKNNFLTVKDFKNFKVRKKLPKHIPLKIKIIFVFQKILSYSVINPVLHTETTIIVLISIKIKATISIIVLFLELGNPGFRILNTF